jgi:TM2 domain-containing membrane protein YozV/Tfp pilus assembly major pilin PilA
MVFCWGCAKEIHESAATCPSCGAAQNRNRKGRSKVAAGLLAIFLGGWGIHRFYLGQWWGLFYLLFSWTMIPSVVSFVEGIVFLVSGDATWDRKYGDKEPGNAAVIAVVAIAVPLFWLSIIGILAAIAIPQYQNYVVRSKVSEGLALAAAAKPAVVSTFHTLGHLPQDGGNLAYGLPYAASITGTYVRSIKVVNGSIVITYKNNIDAIPNNATLTLTPFLEKNSAVGWYCGKYHTTIPNEYLPRNCRYRRE